MTDINLLPQRDAATQEEKRIRTILVTSISLLTLSLIIFETVLFIFSAVVTNVAASSAKRRAEIITELSPHEQTASDLRAIHTKIKGIKQIQTMQTNFGSVIGDVQKIFAADASITKLSLDTTGKISLAGVSSSLKSFGDLSDRLSSTSLFNKITLTEIADKNSAIGFSLDMVISKNE